jgi:hypothetical protein
MSTATARTGRTPLGRAIDRNYLNAIGWRGVRQRKLDLESLVRVAADRLRAAGAPVVVLDIAAGGARYVIDAFAQGPPPDAIVLRDYDEGNVAKGREMLAASGLDGRARFEQGDALDRAGLDAVRPRPTLGIVSGLYELYDANAPVRQSLAGLADAIAPGGYLVYTGQPWHPQLELIARALTSHRQGRAWVMRRRTQAELDGLVAACRLPQGRAALSASRASSRCRSRSASRRERRGDRRGRAHGAARLRGLPFSGRSSSRPTGSRPGRPRSAAGVPVDRVRVGTVGSRSGRGRSSRTG